MPQFYQYGPIDAGGNPIAVDHVDVSDGIRVYLKGHAYPLKGMPTAEAVQAIATVKKLALAAPFCLRPSLLSIAAMTALQPVLLRPEYMSPCARELRRMIGDSSNLGAIVSHIVEYDSAYRVRVQDALDKLGGGWCRITPSSKDTVVEEGTTLPPCAPNFSGSPLGPSDTPTDPPKPPKLRQETTYARYMLRDHPFRSLYRLGQINRSQDYIGVHRKIRFFLLLIAICLLWPPNKRKWSLMWDSCDFNALLPDEADRYWMALRTDYGPSNENPIGFSFLARLFV